jgi:hypothetical protein
VSVKSSRYEDKIGFESHQAGKYLISAWGGFNVGKYKKEGRKERKRKTVRRK